jgi:anti-sigma factor RsiW
MQNHDPITEADLHAYVDGRLSENRREQVDAYLARNVQVRERLQRYGELNRSLRAHFAPVLDEPIPARLLRPTPARPGFHLPRVAAVAAWLLIGSVVGATLQYALSSRPLPPIEADLIRPAAFAHVIYTPEERHPVEVSADQEDHLVGWLSKRLHTDIRAPDLSGIDYRLVGGRLLPSTNRMAAQFMYENAAGKRITLYVRTGAWENRDTAFHYTRADGVGVFYWIDGTMGYAILGDADEEELFSIAAATYRELGEPS